MAEDPSIGQNDQPIKHGKLILVILVLILIASSVGLIRFCLTRKFPCDICFDYPDWWVFVYPIKNIIAISGIYLIWKWQRIGVWGLGLVAVINATAQIVFEYDILHCAAALFSIGVLYFAIKDEWYNYQ